jgi:hypothetical protein
MTNNKVIPFPKQTSPPLKKESQPTPIKPRFNFWKKWAQKRLKKKQLEKSLLLHNHPVDSKE